MARYTLFGTINSDTDLHLIQQRVDVAPAQPKVNYKDIPGADGSRDFTEALGVGVKYYDREIEWTYALYPGEDWRAKQRQVSNALNGLACHITLDDDQAYYYDGRLAVTEYASDRLLRQITITATCRPYKLKQAATEVSRADLSTSLKTLTLTNDRRPVVPSITVGQSTTLTYNGGTYVLAAGVHKVPEIVLQEGSNTLKAKISSGSGGTITVSYQEGSL